MRHRLGNIVRRVGAFAVAATLIGCGGGRRPVEGPRSEVSTHVPPPTRVESVFVLESGGAAPEDTTVAIGPRQARVIILRRSAPDNSLFAQLTIPADTTQAAAVVTDSVRVTVRPRPGRYGVDVEIEGTASAGIRLTISYAVHFVAPAGARTQYGSDLGFEKALFLAQLAADGTVTFLPTSRPGSDQLSAVLPGPGRFVVAAPKS